MIIQLDFDGTVVNFDFPNIGRLNVGCIEVVKALFNAGHHIYLNTYRANISEEALAEALNFLEVHEIISMLSGINPQKKIPPAWNPDESIKNGELFIDDDSEGIALKWDHTGQIKMVDWRVVKSQLIQKNIIY